MCANVSGPRSQLDSCLSEECVWCIRACVWSECVCVHFYSLAFSIPLWESCSPRQRAAGRQTEKILRTVHSYRGQVRLSGSYNNSHGSKSKVSVSPETEGSRDSGILSDSRFERERKVFSGDRGRENFLVVPEWHSAS